MWNSRAATLASVRTYFRTPSHDFDSYFRETQKSTNYLSYQST